jgi:dGTPase
VTYTSHDTERWVAEPPKRPERTQFQRDRARVLHSSALRRLASKTQVMRAGLADFPRTRLTHSLECAQIGRDLGAVLGCDPDLVDAAGLAHDLGHPPFGHNGESALAALAGPSGPLACGGFEGNAQSMRLLTRLEPKVPGAGLNLTRATLDAALKYPWVAPGSAGSADLDPPSPDSACTPENVTLHLPAKYGAYEADIAVFTWIRAGAPGRRRCLEAQVMDWADDVAYSVHDLEDGLDAGLVSIKNLTDPAERSVVSAVARTYYCPPSWDVTAAELDEVFAELIELDCWQFSFDGGPAALAAAKNLTSELVGRFCQAAEDATRAAAGTSRLARYSADLVVPRRQLLECALLKAVAAHYVMRRQAAVDQQAREREVITELALAIERGAPATLDPVFQPAWDVAPTDSDRRRVIIDQLASLTDTSALAVFSSLCPRPPAHRAPLAPAVLSRSPPGA